jgi:hypothetical protein
MSGMFCNVTFQTLFLQSIHPSLADFATIWHRRETQMMKKVQPKNDLEFAMVLVATAYLDYQKYEQSFALPVFFYEDLVDDPVKTLKPILNICGIPEEKVSLCLDCMKYDSQAGTPLSREAARKSKPTFTTEDQRTIAKIMNLIGYLEPEAH